MKTTSQKNTKTGAQSRPEQVSRENKTTLIQIDLKKRLANRMLGTQQLLSRLQKDAPDFYAVAEVVGKWVWIQFDGKQPSSITSALSEFGFHWNNRRQSWQHPCGRFTKSAQFDPRSKYGSYIPSQAKAA